MFSIIIPVYNSEKYLEQCLNSIINQSYQEFEVIIVNDGSTDNSLDICKKFCKRYKKIKLINQKNKGVSAARNIAISLAKEKYIMFIDADDFLDELALEKIYNKLNDIDLLCFSYKKIYKNKTVDVELENDLDSKEKIQDRIFLDDKIGGFVWNKVFKREIIIENEICFRADIHYCEDYIFLSEYLKFCKKIKYCRLAVYNYRMRKSSVSFDFYNKKNVSVLKSFEKLTELYNNIPKYYYKFCYDYILSYYKFKKIVDDDFKNEKILNLEYEIVKNKKIKEKIKFYFLKYFPKLYRKIREIKNKQIDLYE